MSDFQAFILISAFAYIKYFTVMGIPYYIFWVLKPKWTVASKIQIVERAKPQAQLELKYSVITLAIQSIFFFAIYKLNQINVFSIVSEQSVGKDLLALAIYIAIYDPFFYFLHKLMHTRWLYRNVHVIHHRSLNPTPFATYSFHPIEASANLIYFIPFLLLTPVSFPMFVGILLFTDIFNLAGHLGHEVIPESVQNSFWGKWITTPTHHNVHHQVSNSNFGLYFNGWDVLFKTLNAKDKRIK
jgi:Delta7-sterol 5-desaturase